MKKSTKSYMAEAKRTPSFSLTQWVHGYIYGRWVYQYISIGLGKHWSSNLLTKVFKLFVLPAKFLTHRSNDSDTLTFSDTYHGKVISTAEAKKLVTINREIKIDDLEQVIPYKRARSIILKNPDHIVVLDCPCRAARQSPCLPLDVCIIIGEPFASFVNEHHPHKSRFISSEEALAILQQEQERGHVHHAFFKDAMLNRFYAICNCCGCCCGAIESFAKGTPMLASSGFVAAIDQDLCLSCLSCIHSCQFKAIQLNDDKKAEVAFNKCLGCGVCVEKCSIKAISLLRDETKGIPLEIEALMHACQKDEL